MSTDPSEPEAHLTLRPAGPEDADTIRDVVHDAYAGWVPVLGYPPRPMTVDYCVAVREHRIELLFSGAEVVGILETDAEPDALLIVNVAVAPNRQGEGLGRRLLAHAEARAADAGLDSIRLYTNAKMLSNIALYERLGYVRVREEAVPGGAIVHLVKRLDGTARA